jgi:predicted DNA-binding transcriptional regulator AlpA
MRVMTERTAKSIEPLEPAEIIEGALGLPRGFLANKRADQDGPRFYRLGRRTVRYRRGEVIEWVSQCQFAPPRKTSGAT